MYIFAIPKEIVFVSAPTHNCLKLNMYNIIMYNIISYIKLMNFLLSAVTLIFKFLNAFLKVNNFRPKTNSLHLLL